MLKPNELINYCREFTISCNFQHNGRFQANKEPCSIHSTRWLEILLFHHRWFHLKMIWMILTKWVYICVWARYSFICMLTSFDLRMLALFGIPFILYTYRFVMYIFRDLHFTIDRTSKICHQVLKWVNGKFMWFLLFQLSWYCSESTNNKQTITK